MIYFFIFGLIIPFFIGALGGIYVAQDKVGRVTALITVVGLAILSSLIGAGLAQADDNKVAMDLLRQTVVQVNGLSCGGSGSVVQGKSGKHYILTNAHVCNCAKYKDSIFTTTDSGELIKGTVVKLNWDYDLCAAEIPRRPQAIKLGSRPHSRTEVNTRGYPGMRLTESHGFIKGSVDWALLMPVEDIGYCPLSSTKLYNLNGNPYGCKLVFTSTLTSLYARPGASGSAVVDDSGGLVGVISSFHPDNAYDAGMTTYEQTERFLNSL